MVCCARPPPPSFRSLPSRPCVRRDRGSAKLARNVSAEEEEEEEEASPPPLDPPNTHLSSFLPPHQHCRSDLHGRSGREDVHGRELSILTPPTCPLRMYAVRAVLPLQNDGGNAFNLFESSERKFRRIPPSLGAPTAFPPLTRGGREGDLDSIPRGDHTTHPPNHPLYRPYSTMRGGGNSPSFCYMLRPREEAAKAADGLLVAAACDPHYFCCCYYFFSLRREGPDRRATPEFEWFRKQALQTRTLKKPSAHLSKIAEQEAHFPPLLYVFPPTVNPERRSETFFHARACNQVARKATSKLGEETLQ